MTGHITLLTDFGLGDGYVGALKGVIAAIAPQAQVVDLAHDLPCGDVAHAAWVLRTAAPCWPAGTAHVAVVDPGVGTDRRAVALAVDDQVYFAPDNGLLSWVLRTAGTPKAIELTNAAFWRHPVSATFHGRDVFAPAAAYLVAGVPFSALGQPLDADTLVRLDLPADDPTSRRGVVVAIDRFGNAITSLCPVAVEGAATVVVGERAVPLRRAFAEAAPGEALAYVGSSGRLEIGVNRGSAAEALGLRVGAPVAVGGACAAAVHESS
jgi:S-adenosylmethionine hydrolase